MTYLILVTVILILGVLSYFSSAWFGYHSSNFGPLPPHYDHLRRRLKKEEQQRKAIHEDFIEENEWLSKY